MTLLQVSCGLDPPIKNPGYAYGRGVGVSVIIPVAASEKLYVRIRRTMGEWLERWL